MRGVYIGCTFTGGTLWCPGQDDTEAACLSASNLVLGTPSAHMTAVHRARLCLRQLLALGGCARSKLAVLLICGHVCSIMGMGLFA